MPDALSDIMRRIRLKGVVYFQRDFHAPWAMRIEGTGFAQFHVITRGSCVVVVDDRSHECAAGDILFFPRGKGHVLADRPDRDALPGPQVMASFQSDAPCFAEGDLATRVICGHYEYQTPIEHPLLSDLPEFIHIKTVEIICGDADVAVLPLILQELAGEKPGQTLIIELYAEALLIQTLRLHYKLSGQRSCFFAGLADRRLERAISRIHGDYALPIGLSELAESAGMSRSSLAHHFKNVVGQSPIEYLTRWRMLAAGDILIATNLPIARVAQDVGYESDIAFARAFRRIYGIAPSAYRNTGIVHA